MAARKGTGKEVYVIVRSNMAGVYFGKLVGRDGSVVELAEARLIYNWVGAETVNGIAANGLDVERSQVDSVTARAVILGCDSVTECSPAAVAKLLASKWGRG